MKTKLIIGLFISMAFVSEAQTYFGNDDCWTEFWVTYDTNMITYKSQHYLDGDTLIEGKTYKKMIERTPNNLQQPTSYLGAIREDAGKVFARYTDYGYKGIGEFLLYDFTVKVGDTIRSTAPYGELSQKPVVWKIDTIELLTGEKRKRFIFRNGGSDWIEGIGCVFGFFSQTEPAATSVSVSHLVCYKQGGTAYYTDNSYCPDGACCDVVTGLENPKLMDQTISLSPNPTNRFVRLDFSKSINRCKSIRLMDELGNTLQKTTKIENADFELDLMRYSQGLYFVVFEFEKSYELHKIVKL